MTHVLDYSIISVRLIIEAILCGFFFHQWQLRKFNGIIRKVRNMTTWFGIALFVQNGYQIIQRFIVAQDLPTNTGQLDWVAFATSLFLLGAISYGVLLVRKINTVALATEHS